MGIKNAILGAVATKAITSIAAKAITAKSKDEIPDSKPTLTNRKGEFSPAYEYIMNSKSNCLLMQHSVFDMNSLKEYTGKERLNFYDYFGAYKIFDKNEQLKYVVLEKRRGIDEEFAGKDVDKMYLYDLSGKLLGKVKEHFIALNMPIAENNSKVCSVSLNGNKILDVKRYYSFGKEHFKINYTYDLEHNKNKEFFIKKGNSQVSKISIFRTTFKELFARTVVMEYNESENELITILLAIAIDIVSSY